MAGKGARRPVGYRLIRRSQIRDRFELRRRYFGPLMRKPLILLLALAAGLLGAARALFNDRWAQDQDEIDLAAIVASRRIRMRARPFIGATILVAAAVVELDLRRVLPAPTGVEISILMFGGSLRVVIPPGWRVSEAVKTRAALVRRSAEDTSDDAPFLRLQGSAWLSRIEVIQRPAPVAVAS